MIRATAAFALALAQPAGAFELALPVDCTLGDDCYIQQYFDHDPGPGATDFTCGTLAYDGHDGTDFAVPTRRAMQAGVAVLAAAPGRVKGTRDGVADFAPVVDGKDCGNGVIIDHGWGWETQYCHLKEGSVRVKKGDVVSTGTPLGLIGQSGLAEFPHLHLSVRKDGGKLDPFSLGASACGGSEDDLWARDLPLKPGGFLDIGITTVVPDYFSIKFGLISADLPKTARALVVWAYYFGTRAGDEIALSITGPKGEIISGRAVIEKTQALSFRAVGSKLKGESWPPGDYRGTAALIRAGQQIDRIEISIAVRP